MIKTKLPKICVITTTLFVSFSSNTEVQEVIVKSMTPVYDENSTIEITEDNGSKQNNRKVGFNV